MTDYQAFLVVGKDFIVFLKDKLEYQGEIDPRGVSHLIFVAHNKERFDIPFYDITGPQC